MNTLFRTQVRLVELRAGNGWPPPPISYRAPRATPRDTPKPKFGIGPERQRSGLGLGRSSVLLAPPGAAARRLQHHGRRGRPPVYEAGARGARASGVRGMCKRRRPGTIVTAQGSVGLGVLTPNNIAGIAPLPRPRPVCLPRKRIWPFSRAFGFYTEAKQHTWINHHMRRHNGTRGSTLPHTVDSRTQSAEPGALLADELGAGGVSVRRAMEGHVCHEWRDIERLCGMSR